MPAGNGEGMQVLKYSVGQEYEGHYDYFFHPVSSHTFWEVLTSVRCSWALPACRRARPPRARRAALDRPAACSLLHPPAYSSQEGTANGGNRYLTVLT